MQCEFCKKTYASKSSLNYHKKTTKACLQLQKNQLDKQSYSDREQVLRTGGADSSISFQCEFCNKILSSKDILKRHYSRCKNKRVTDTEKLKEEIETLKQEKIDRLEKQLEDYKQMSKVAKVVNNTNNYNIKKLDQKILNLGNFNDLKNRQVEYALGEHYNDQYLMKGISGLANFCIEHLLKTPDNKLRMICTDPSRNVFIFKDDNGAVHKEIGADTFINMISNPVKERSERVFQEMDYKFNQLKEEMDEDEDAVLLDIESQRMVYAQEKKMEVQNLEGNKINFINKLKPPLSKSLICVPSENEIITK